MTLKACLCVVSGVLLVTHVSVRVNVWDGSQCDAACGDRKTLETYIHTYNVKPRDPKKQPQISAHVIICLCTYRPPYVAMCSCTCRQTCVCYLSRSIDSQKRYFSRADF